MTDSTERGFTLVELMLAIAVTGLIVSFLGSGIYQMLTVSGYGNDRLTALHELQNAAHWFHLDGQRAADASLGSGLVLTIPESPPVTYSLDGTELRRTDGGAPMTLARNITRADFSLTDRILTLSLTSSPEGREGVSENGTYRVYLRPSAGVGNE